ncbi:MAG: hypothetical protein AB8B49_06155 [Nitratireductor sp.]
MSELNDMSASNRASFKRTSVFMLLGFTLSFGFFLALARLLFLLYMNDDNAGSGGGLPLRIMGNSFMFAFPVSIVALFLINTKRKIISIDTLKSFLSTLFIAMLAVWLIFAMSGFVFGDLKLVKHFGVLGAFIPPIGLLAGAVLWRLRHMFGVKSL